MNVETLASVAVDCGLRIHKELGSGLLETAYEAVLAHLLAERGLLVERQKLVPIKFGNVVIDDGFRADLIVERALLIELKAVERLAPVHGKQVLTYLRFLDLRLGLLMNFGAPTLREGLKRVVNDHASAAYQSSRPSRSSRESNSNLGELGVLGVRPTSCKNGGSAPTSAL